MVGAPPATSIRFNFPVLTNASDLLSGDQNGLPATAVPATARASLALYNTRQDLDALVQGLHTVQEVFKL